MTIQLTLIQAFCKILTFKGVGNLGVGNTNLTLESLGIYIENRLRMLKHLFRTIYLRYVQSYSSFSPALRLCLGDFGSSSTANNNSAKRSPLARW